MKLWTTDIFFVFRNLIRFLLWTCLVLDLFIVAVFTVFFTYEFTVHLWQWCQRTLFTSPW